MTDFRRQMWNNIMADLGPPVGCIVPLWLRIIYIFLFPLQGLKILLDGAAGFDYLRLTWKIHGIEFSDQVFVRMALAEDRCYRFRKVSGVLTVEAVLDPTLTPPLP